MDERIRCSYCLQELNDMKDPRQLTCTHIFCMSCIRSDCKQESAVKCPICRKVTNPAHLDSLDKPSEKKLSRKPEGQVTEHKCNRCEDNTDAVSYCLECADLICDKHLQTHQKHFKKSHTIIDVLTYSKNPAAYTKVFCSEHKTSTISQVCSRCYLLACSDCNPPQRCPKSMHPAEDHRFHTLTRMAEDFKQEFSEPMKDCADKVTEICNLEKEAWLKFDSLIEKCQKMVADVKKRAEEQIAEIRKSSQQLIKQIHDYRVDKTNRVQVFVSDLLMKREELEELQKSVRHLVRSCSVAEKIQQKEEKISALKKGKEMRIHQCDLEEAALATIAKQGRPKHTSIRLATSLTHLNDYQTRLGERCRSITFTPEGQLLIACDGYLFQRDPNDMGERTECRQMGRAIKSLAAGNSNELIFLLYGGNIQRSTEPYDSMTTISNVPTATKIATFENNLYVLSSKANRLIKRSLSNNTDQTYSIGTSKIVSICCHPDGDLLAVSKQSGVLYKYRVDEEKKELEQIWSCNELPGAYAVCTDKCGWIYVAASGSRLYIVAEGKIYRCLESDQLAECEDPEYGDIAVYDDTLVALQCGSRYFNIFSLKQE